MPNGSGHSKPEIDYSSLVTKARQDEREAVTARGVLEARIQGLRAVAAGCRSEANDYQQRAIRLDGEAERALELADSFEEALRKLD